MGIMLPARVVRPIVLSQVTTVGQVGYTALSAGLSYLVTSLR